MHHGNRQPTYTGFILHVQYRAVHVVSVRIGAVQYQHLAVVFCTSVHQPAHRGIISIESQAYILDVYHKDIELAHGCFAWFPGFPVVQREDRYSGLLVYRAGHMFACVGISSETVFRGENGYYIELVFQQNIQQMLVSYHSCMIGEYGNSFIF